MFNINRRDFLKLAAKISAGVVLSSVRPGLTILPNAKVDKPNIIILVFDSMSARNLSVYGYARRTTPNLERFAQRAMVYHSHYSGGNFTTPGTSSLLTGMYPWTHRAINMGGLIKRNLAGQSIFSLIGKDYYRAAYSQNLWPEVLLRQFRADIDWHISTSQYKYADKDLNILLGEPNIPDGDMIYYALDAFLYGGDTNPWPGSLAAGYLDSILKDSHEYLENASKEYPYGIPYNTRYYYQIPTVLAGVTGIIDQLAQHESPFLGYFHIWFPHQPFRPRAEFVNIFPEIAILRKPRHPLSRYSASPKDYVQLDNLYDEYVADLDAEFGKLLDVLESTGVLDASYVIVTSDHGQLFERGEEYHITPLLYDPIIHIPLLISAPGNKERQDVFTPTSAVDLLPTLLNVTGQPIPALVEGRLLPGFGGEDDLSRSIFTIEAKHNSAFKPLTEATVSMIKGDLKLIYYEGYENYNNIFELYDLHNDLEEMQNLFKRDNVIASQLKNELLNALHVANLPFES